MTISLLPFFIILVAGLILPEIFNRLHLPYVTGLIVTGIIIGPGALNLVEINETIQFLGEIGLIFLMFIAGTEVEMKKLNDLNYKIFLFVFLNGLIPFCVGYLIATAFGQPTLGAVLLGTTFISTSIAVVIPSLEKHGLIHTEIGRLVIPATIIEDAGALLLLAIILQNDNATIDVPLPIYFLILIGVIILLKLVINFLERFFTKRNTSIFQQNLRFAVAVLIAAAVIFELLGLGSIIAGFVIGIFLRDFIKKEEVEEKIKTISYGIFIPAFFLTVGLTLDTSSILNPESASLIFVIVLGLIISKFFSASYFGMLTKLGSAQSNILGFITIPQLTTTLATVYAANERGLLGTEFVNALIVLALVTTLIAPIGVNFYANRIGK